MHQTGSSDWVSFTPACKKLPAKQYARLSGSTHMLADPAVSERVWARLMRHFLENL